MAIKCRQECQSDCPEYKTIANTVNFAIKQLKKQRLKRSITHVERADIIKKIHTLLVAKWIAARKFGIQTSSIAKELINYHRACHVSVVDELFFLKHYRYHANDLRNYQQQFKEELNYGMEII